MGVSEDWGPCESSEVSKWWAGQSWALLVTEVIRPYYREGSLSLMGILEAPEWEEHFLDLWLRDLRI